MVQRLEHTVLDLIESAARNLKAQPLNLGGISGPSGGVGGPPAGFIGWLVQTRVSYDETEAATLFTPSSGMSLVDNLNHIRYRLGVLESGILVVDEWDGSPTISGVNHITFSGAVVTDLGDGHALVQITASGGSGTPLTVESFGGGTVVNNVDKITLLGPIVADAGGGDVLVIASPPITVEEVDGNPSVSSVDKIIFSGATVTDLGSGDVLVSIASGGAGGGDGTYLRLDATNDPVTGPVDIEITGSSDRYGLQINTDENNSPGIIVYAVRGEGGIFGTNGSYNAGYFEQFLDDDLVTDKATIHLSRWGTNAVFDFDAPAIRIEDGDVDAIYSGGTLRHTDYNNDVLVEINPYVPSGGTMILTDSVNPINSAGRLISLKNQGNEKFSVNGLGSTNIPPGQFYMIDGIPHTHAATFNDAEGDPEPIGTAADGTSAYPARRDHVHATTTGTAVLGSGFSITGTAGTYQDTGLSVTLPSAGKYKITCDVRGALKGNAGLLWWIHAKLYNSTDAADVANSERLVTLVGTTGVDFQNTAPINKIIDVNASKTIKLYAARNGAGSPSWTVSEISSDSNGKTEMSYEKIG